MRLQDQFVRLAETPGIGQGRDDLIPNIRSAVQGNYVVFYRIVDDGIQIIRVLHGARDIPAIFDEMSE